MQFRIFLLAPVLFSASAALAQPRLVVAALTSGGARTSNGSLVAVGQPVVGRAQSGAVGAHVGIIPCIVSPLCRADFNSDGGVDGDDVIGFFGVWDNGDIAADFNRDGGVDGDDVIEFFVRWDAGC
ncbi:MAG: GC-type dockerin domain-anchored protein [Phycisphaerales bacterium]